MIWNKHSELEGKHAFLGASNYYWINWPDDIFEQRYYGQYSTQIGTAIHELAKDCILSRTKLNKGDRHIIELEMFRNDIPSNAYDSNQLLTILIPYVNDAIGFRMVPEQILFYSYNCFGTTDAIIFNEKEKILRIHDLKTGTIPAHMEQLLIYSALFCLEYHKNPFEFKTELRIYQNGEVVVHEPEPNDINDIMSLIENRNNIIKNYINKEA